eukprot:4096822-Prymnesium_polylepis.1
MVGEMKTMLISQQRELALFESTSVISRSRPLPWAPPPARPPARLPLPRSCSMPPSRARRTARRATSR